MKLEKIKNDIPDIVSSWAEQNAASGRRFVSVLQHRYGEVVERTFAIRRSTKKILITEVRRRATGNSNTIVKNIYYTRMGGYIPVFYPGKKQSYYVYFYPDEFDVWFECSGGFQFPSDCLNAEMLNDIDEFKYCGYGNEGDVIQYLNEYRSHPCVEFFGKLGVPVSSSLIKKAEKDKRFRTYIFKYASDIRKFGPQATVYAYKNEVSISDAYSKLCCRKRMARELSASARMQGLNAEKIFEYIEENKIGTATYNDYLEAVIGLGLDVTDTKVLYPKDFNAMHDVRVAEYESLCAKQDREKRTAFYKAFAEAGQKAADFEFSDDTYSIIAPRDVGELVTEGKALHHCVGKMGYDKKMADGEIYIMFVRKKDNIKTPYVTIEYDLGSKKIRQAHGEYNTGPSEDVEVFLSNWLSFVKKCEKR